MDIDPIEPAQNAGWTRIVRRREPGEDGASRHYDPPEDDAEPDEELTGDEDGHQHIDVRV
ncbi:MAG TPA: hypothetical protein VH063_19245 [Gaiellaceae bacterium]|jgi:hypothetical protein|nr:hypothetical protein [Gaiellaceae bacterium]